MQRDHYQRLENLVMINLTFLHNPFTTERDSGDFIIQRKYPNGDLVLVGDIGGHGQRGFEDVKSAIDQVVSQQPAQLNLKTLVLELCALEELQTHGLVLFAGFFDDDLPVLHYIHVGDVKAHQIQFGDPVELPHQNGMLVLNPIPTLKEFSLKIRDSSRFIFSSDGVRTVAGTQKPPNWHGPATDLCKYMIDNLTDRSDDALAVVCDYRYSPIRTPDRSAVVEASPEPVIEKRQPNQKQADSSKGTRAPVVQQPVSETKAEHRIPAAILDLPSDSDKLLSASEMLNARLGLRVLFRSLGFSNIEQNRWCVFYLEVREQVDRHFNLYLTNTHLITTIRGDRSIAETLAPLRSSSRFSFSEAEQLIQLEHRLPRAINDMDLARQDLIDLVKLGTDTQTLESIKEEQSRERVLAEQAKLASMGEMIGSIAHQWRQPLNELALQAQNLQLDFYEDLLNEERLGNYVADVLNIVKYMSNTIDDFRNFLKSDNTTEDASIRDIVDQVINLQQAQLESNEVEVHLEGDGLTVNCMPSEFKQVLMILVNNAKDALQGRDSARKLSVRIEGTALSIIDNAGGMPSDVMARATEPYFTTKTSGKGTGLGLYIAKQIVEDKLDSEFTLDNAVLEDEPGLAVRINFNPRLVRSEHK